MGMIRFVLAAVALAMPAAQLDDIVLPAHPELVDLLERKQRGESVVRPGLIGEMTAKSKAAFDTELAKQRAAVKR